MTLDNKPVYTGGCQCGAVRFRVEGALGRASICHCRMCQKAFGSFYAPLVSVAEGTLHWMRGEPKRFQSSNHVRRGFCSDCGTPLTYDYHESRHINLTTGSFDQPERFLPKVQFGIEARLPVFDELPLTAEGTTEETMAAQVAAIRKSNHQHPDHDTESWPPQAA